MERRVAAVGGEGGGEGGGLVMAMETEGADAGSHAKRAVTLRRPVAPAVTA